MTVSAELPESFGRLYEEFKMQAEAVSAVVERAPDIEAARRLVADITAKKCAAGETGAPSAVAAPSRLIDQLSPEKLTALSGVTFYTGDLRRHAASAGVGLSSFDLAVAETGSLVQDATRIDQRLVSTLPPVHIAVLYTSSLAPSLRAALARFAADLPALPSYVSFITGPSRTADIERVLTIGVHGPGELYIIFVDGAGEAE